MLCSTNIATEIQDARKTPIGVEDFMMSGFRFVLQMHGKS